jgi:uncharacterized delta-60 repeat protein
MKAAMFTPLLYLLAAVRERFAILPLFLLALSVPKTRAGDGDLDPAFGIGGKVSTDIDGYFDLVKSITIAPNGDILAAGYAYGIAGGESKFALARFTPAGAIQPSFGEGGKVTTAFNGYRELAYGIATDSGDRIFVAGSTQATSTFNSDDFALACYTSSGALDTSFGSGGKITTDFHGGSDIARCVMVDSIGRIVVAGSASNVDAGFGNFAIARYTSTGTLDSSFGSGGKVTTDFFGSTDYITAAMLDSTGRIVVAGSAYNNGGIYTFALARFTSAGVLDPSFGIDGKVTHDFHGADADARSLTIDNQGRIVVAGRTSEGGPNFNFALARYSPSGDLDPAFGTDGTVFTDFGEEQHEEGQAVAIDASGRIIVAGNTRAGGQLINFAVACYTSEGMLDPSFGIGGTVITDFYGEIDEACAVAIDAAGKIVVAGRAQPSGGGPNDHDFAIARYISAPSSPSISLRIGPTQISSGGSYNFGAAVNLGQETSATVTITNSGNAPLTGIAASITPAGNSDFRIGTLPPPTTIDGGDSGTFNVIFSPQALGNRPASLNVTSNAAPSPYLIQLQGTGTDTVPPVITSEATGLTIICDAPDKMDMVNAWLTAHGTAAATDISGSVIWSHDFTTLPGVCGAVTVTFTAADSSGNSSTTAAQLTSVDNTAPSITVPAASLTVESNGQGNAVERSAWLNSQGGATATDACTAVTWTHNFTGLANTLPQTVPVVFSANDSCGNSTATSASFIIQDTTPPQVTVPAAPYYGDCNEAASDIADFLATRSGAQAVDIAGPVTWTHDYNGTLPPCEGYITVTFTATDTVGLTASTSARFFLFPPGAIWIGPAAGTWTTAADWDDGTLPTAATDTYVDLFDFQDTILQVPAGSRSTKHLIIGQGDVLRLGGSGTVSLTVAGETIRNAGEVQVQGSNIRIGGATTLMGNGRLVMTGDGSNRLERGNSSPLDVLTVSSGQEITTSADTLADYQRTSIHAGLINHGTVTADTGGMTLYFEPKTNRGTFRAINGGLLRMETPVDNVGGMLISGTGSGLWLQETLTGGMVTGSGRLLMNSNAGLTGPLTLDSGLTTAVEGGTTKLTGTILNNSQILISVPAGGSAASLSIDGAVTLDGSGTVTLQGAGNRRIMRANSSVEDVLTVGAEQEITATAGTIAEYQNGAIHAGLVNHGTITADGGGLTLYANPKTNLGLFRAINGGLLRMEVPVNNAHGTFFVGEGSTLKLEDTLTGGIVNGNGRLLMNSAAGITGPIALDSSLTIAVEGGTTELTGTITHDGHLLLGNANPVTAATLDINGEVALNGTGRIVLQGGNASRLIERANSSASDVLILHNGQEITTTAGTIASSQRAGIKAGLVNHGIVTADQGGLAMTHNAKTNHNIFRAIRGGSLVITGSTLTNYNATTDTLTGGRWEVIAEGSTTTLDIQSAPVTTIAANTHVCLSGANASFPQLSTLTTVAGTLCLENGKSFTTAGNLTVSGTLEFGLTDGGVNGFDAGRIVINGNADFTGATIHIRDRGITAGIYEIARWTGTVTGNPVLGDLPQGLNYGLLRDTETKTLRLQIIDNLPKILAIHHDATTGTTTIDYQSVSGVIHHVRGTSDFIHFNNLPDTLLGTGGVLQYLHQPEESPDKYFYLFSSPLP